MACKIIRDNEGNITKVYQQNGEVSKLFNKLNDVLGDSEVAYSVYNRSLIENDANIVEPTFEQSIPYVVDARKNPNEYKKLIREAEHDDAASTLLNNIDSFLSGIGVSVTLLDTIIDTNTNEPINLAAKANLSQRMIYLAQDKATLQDLNEEAAHFLVEILAANEAPLYTSMQNQIVEYQIYKNMMDPDNYYYQRFEGNEDLIKREAMAKVITMHLIGKSPARVEDVGDITKENPNKLSRLQRWGTKFLAWIKKLFRSNMSDSFLEGTELIINNSLNEYLQKEKSLYGSVSETVLPDLEMASTGTDPDAKTKATMQKLDKFDTYKSQPIPVGDRADWILLKEEGSETIDRYQNVNDPNKILDARMSDAASLHYKESQKNKIKTYQEKEEEEFWKRTLEERKIKGTAGHDVLEKLLKYHANGDKSLSREQIKNESTFTTRQFELMEANLKAIMKHLQSVQDTIDPSKKVVFRAEQFILNEDETMGGTIDLLAIFSDNSAAIYDYKFSTPGRGFLRVYKGGVSEIIRDPWASKTERYDIQLSTYKEALVKKYGITHIRESRVIPIALTYEYKNGRPINVVKQMKMGGQFLRKYYSPSEKSKFREETDALYLDPIPVAGEVTGIKGLDKLITKEQDRLKLLIDSKEKATFGEKQVIDKNIGISRNILKRLILKKSVDAGVEAAALIAKRVDSGLQVEDEFKKDGTANEKYLTNSELLQAYQDLKHFEGFLKLSDLFKYYDGIIKRAQELGNSTQENEAKREKEKISELLKDTGTLRTTLDALEAKMVERTVDFAKSKGVEGLTTYNTTVSGFTKWAVSLSNQTNPYLRTIYETRDVINAKMTQVTKDLAVQIETERKLLFEYGRGVGIYGAKIYDEIIDPVTMNLHAKWSQEWRAQKEQAIATGNIKWLKEHFEIDKDFFKNKGNYNWKRLESDLRKTAERTQGSETTKQKEFDRLKKRWDVRSHDSAWLNPKNLKGGFGLKLKASTREKFKSTAWKKIESTPALKRFYEYHEKMVFKFSGMLGVDLASGFTANVQKDLTDVLVENGFNLNHFTQAGLDLFQMRQHDLGFGVTDKDGNFVRHIPRLYTRELRDKNNNIDRTLKTKDLGKSLYLLGVAAFQYKYHLEVLPELSLMETLLKDNFKQAEELQTDLFGKLVFDANKNVRTKVSKANAETFTDILNQEIFGRSLKTKDTVFQNRVSVNKSILALKNYHSITTLGLSLPVSLGALGAGMVGLHVQASKGIFYNHKQLLSAEKSLVTRDPKMQAIMEFFDLSLEDLQTRRGDLLSATFRAKYMNSDRFFEFLARADKTVDAILAVAMAKNHGIDPKTGELKRLKELPEGSKSIYDSIEYKEDPKWDRGSVRDRYIVTLKGFSAEKINKSITDKKRKELELTNDKALNAWRIFKARVRRMSAKTKGTMDINDRALFNNQIWGRLFMHYRSWLPSLAYERFGQLRYDYVLDHYDQGTWRALLSNVGPGKSFDSIDQALQVETTWLEYLSNVGLDVMKVGVDIGTFGLVPAFKVKTHLAEAEFDSFLLENTGNPKFANIKKGTAEYTAEFEKFVEMKRANIRGVLSELRAVLSLIALTMALGGDWDEDGDIDIRETFTGRKVHNIFNRIYREVAFFMDPLELTGPRATGIPLMTLGQQAYRFAGNSIDEIIDNVTQREDRKDDSYNEFHFFFKSLPGQGLVAPLEIINPKKDKHSRTN